MIRKKLNREFLNWFLENENIFQLRNFCIDEYLTYICRPNSNSPINGEEVSEFINKENDLPYKKESNGEMYYD